MHRPPSSAELQTNFVSEKPSSFYADLYKADDLTGGHVIMLGADAESKWVLAHCFNLFISSKCACAQRESIHM